jgi:hypothetical protein
MWTPNHPLSTLVHNSCIPSFTAGVLLVTDETEWRRLGIPRDNLDSVSEAYIGEDFPQTG